MAFEFNFTWVKHKGVRDSGLAATWGEWEFLVNGRVVSELLDLRSRSVRRSAFCSALPLTQWVVDNWWFIFNESSRLLDTVRPGRDLARHHKWRGWVKRHNLLGVGDGMPSPDCYLFRDGGMLRVSWFADPARWDDAAAARFLSDGDEFVDQDEVRSELSRFIEATFQRLRDAGVEAPEDLVADWDAIKASSPEDTFVASNAAVAGVHPYCDLTAEIENELLALRHFSPDVAFDLLSVAGIGKLRELSEQVAKAIEAAGRQVGRLPELGLRKELPPFNDYTRPAYQVGYERARKLRTALGLEPDSPIDEVDQLFEDRFSWPIANQSIEASLEGNLVSGVVLMDGKGFPKLAGPALTRAGNRFRLARGISALLDGVERPQSMQLLTNASDWRQRVGRAFAAEFLAPRDGIIRRLPDETVTATDLNDMARHFMVDFLVIQHQIENHNLATIAIS